MRLPVTETVRVTLGRPWGPYAAGCVDIDTGADLEAAAAQLRAREAVPA